MKDLYKILGVPENAEDAAIKKAYRKLAKELHPDITGGDKKKTDRFKEINDAYTVLGDKEKRAEYDRLKHAPVRPDGMPEGFDADAFARAFGGGARAGRGGVSFGGDGRVDISDLFSSLFGGDGARGGADWGRTNRPRANRGADLVGTIEITLAEAALGTRRSVHTGSGDTVEVSIPPGVETAGRLRVPGAGRSAPGPGPGKGTTGTPGDLYLDVVVLPDRHLRRNGMDLEMDLPITVSEAALGTKVQVPTVEGAVTVTIPPGTSCGAKLRLKGRGIRRGDGARGDQLCRVEVMVPKAVLDDPELRRLFEEIGQRTAATKVRDF
jgi:DnaJ-class molecular chaperone